MLTIVQIETEQAVHNLNEIVAVENARAMGEHMLKGFERLQQEHQIVGEVRGLGLMGASELVKDKATMEHLRTI